MAIVTVSAAAPAGSSILSPGMLMLGKLFIRLLRMWALVAPNVHGRDGVMVLASWQNIVIAECRRLDWDGIELPRFAPTVFRPINVVALQISVRHWRPNQIDERLLPLPAGNSLQPRWCCGWKNVVSHKGDRWAIVALDLPHCALRLCEESNCFNPVVVCLLPFDGAIYKTGSHIGVHRNFSGDPLNIRACLSTMEPVNEPNAR